MRRLYVLLMGGLGNQLFQYAAARNIAYLHNYEILLDLRDTSIYGGKHPFALNHFNIKARIANKSELPAQPINKFKYFLWRHMYCNPRLVKDKDLSVNKFSFVSYHDLYLRGYYQSEKYFINIANILHDELKYITPPSKNNVIMLKNIKANNSVSIHVRRGDYLEKKWSNHFSQCSIQYFTSAIKYISKRTGPPVIYIFTNDIHWVKSNLRFKYRTVISENNQGIYDYEDLRLMSACKHNIISNSTFSWWGAWLNQYSKKIVVTPNKWFTSNVISFPDIVPHEWHKIDN